MLQFNQGNHQVALNIHSKNVVRRLSPMKSAILYFVSSSFALVLSATPGLAYEYSVRHAFCVDTARNGTSIYSSTFQYDLQRAYNQCMRNADALIREHERKRTAENQRIRMQQRQFMIEYETRRALEESKRREQERIRIQRQREIESIVQNADQLFR